MLLHWPQIVLAVILLVGTGISIANHNKPTRTNCVVELIATAVLIGLTWAGGFWS